MSDIELPPPDIPLDIPLDENFIYDPRGNPRGSPPDIYEQMFDIGEYKPNLTDEYVDVEKPSIEQEIIKAKEIIFTRKFDKFNIKQNYLIKNENENENEYTNIGQLISVLINDEPAETVFETKFLTKTKTMKLQIKFQKNITDEITFEYEIYSMRISEHNFFLILNIIQTNEIHKIIIEIKKNNISGKYKVERIIDEHHVLKLYKKKIQTKGGKKSRKHKKKSKKHQKKSRKHKKKSRKHR